MIWPLQKAAYRTLHALLKFLLPLVNVPTPELVSGAGSVSRVGDILRARNINRVLVVTDSMLMDLEMLQGLFAALEKNGVQYSVFDKVRPNPTIKNVEDGLVKYLSGSCQGIIAFGGGSPMDCAKVIGARVVKPKQTVANMRGKFKVRKTLPPIVAIPTTAGTGSETTVVAVISDPENHEKFAVGDLKLVPEVAVLDPELMLGLPPHLTATTGMDALTHAVESYTNVIGTSFTDEKGETAVRLIFENLENAYENGADIESRQNMALASFYAGAAFSRALVGNVHAIAHNLGGLYGTPHGLANAVILPHVLEFSKKDAQKKLAALAVAGGLGRKDEPEADLCQRFIDKVKAMNTAMHIPDKIEDLKEKDIGLLAKRAVKEANPDYPVPTLMNQQACEAILRKLLPH